MAFRYYLTPNAKSRLGITDDYIVVSSETEDAISSRIENRSWLILTTSDGRRYRILNEEIAWTEQVPEFDFSEIQYLLEASTNTEEDEDTEDEESSSSSCFIATACEADSNTLDTLRNFRDTRLIPSKLGKKFVESYYKFAPEAANFIQDKPILKRIILACLILPLSALIKLIEINQKPVKTK